MQFSSEKKNGSPFEAKATKEKEELLEECNRVFKRILSEHLVDMSFLTLFNFRACLP